MKKNRIKQFIAFLLALPLVVSCSQDNDLATSSSETEVPYRFHAKMVLEGGVQHHDQTRASTDWKDGDRVYLQFIKDGVRTDGVAQYYALQDTWDIICTDEPPTGSGTTCEAYYFENAGNASYTNVVLSPESIIYADKAATHQVKDGVVIVNAMLNPITGRIRLQGEKGRTVSAGGFYYYTNYDIKNNTLETRYRAVSREIGDDGYSDYIYGTFPNDKKMLYINDDKNALIYARQLKSNTMEAGHSSYVTLPTQSSHLGWKMDDFKREFTVNGVSFTMITVQGGTFKMGATPEQFLFGNTPKDNEFPVHDVTLSTYSIGETEVTQALWKAVMGTVPQTGGYGDGDNYPVYYLSYNDCQQFVAMLNVLTGMSFRLPTEAEWEYAARGGALSDNNLYSGSMVLSQVATTSYNPTEVKSLKGNELGIYDMSGNVEEWCADWMGNYGSGSEIDPTGPASGTKRVHRGGSWGIDATYCRCASRDGDTPSYQGSRFGFRLAL